MITWRIPLVALLLCVTPKAQEIKSTGLHSSADFYWAVDVDNLQFSFESTESSFVWEHSIETQKLVTFTVNLLSNSSQCYIYEVKVTTPISPTLELTRHGVIYKAECSIEQSGSVLSHFSIVSNLNETFLNSNISVRIPSNPPVERSEGISLGYCQSEIINGNHTISIATTMEKASYNVVGDCVCNRTGALLFYSNGSRTPNTTQCNAFAKWNNCHDAECWYAPRNAVVNQGSKNAKNSGDFSCDSTEGFPVLATVRYYIGEEEVNGNEILSSKYNSKNLRCEVWNEYSNHTLLPAISGNMSLTVYFAPEQAKVDNEREYIEKNSSKKLRFHFYANPENKVIVVTLTSANNTVQNVTRWISDGSNTNFTYMIDVKIENEEDYGKYTFTAYTTMPEGHNSSSVTIEESPGQNPNILLIAGICGGLAFLVIVLLIVYFVIRRNRQKQPEESEREERMNEIYGSAPRHTVDDESSRAKEERANVLYVSSGEAGGIEEAYAAIDKKGKKKSNGNDNTAYSPEVAEVTYAAVNKPKKKNKTEEPQEAVYSAVNKKKKKRDVDKEPGLHGSPTVGEA